MVPLDASARVRVGTWPYDPTVAHLVLVDHRMVPATEELSEVVQQLHRQGYLALRTGALFPLAVVPFLDLGFSAIDRLALLELDLTATPRPERGRDRRTRRLRIADLEEAAQVDRRAFGHRWGNDAAALDDVRRATPRARSRCVRRDGELVGFAISGRAGSSGYLQRLAVDPDAQRSGIGRSLVDDALRWMQRHHATTAMVNTAVDNEAALKLYGRLGFQRRREQLSILELVLR